MGRVLGEVLGMMLDTKVSLNGLLCLPSATHWDSSFRLEMEGNSISKSKEEGNSISKCSRLGALISLEIFSFDGTVSTWRATC